MITVDGSLKRRLATWLLATTGILGSLLLIEAYTSARHAAHRAFDSQLEAASLTIAEAVQWQDGQPLLEIPAAAFQILATDQQERVFYALIDSHGRELTGNLDGLVTPAMYRAAGEGPVWRFSEYRGIPIRLYGYQLRSPGWELVEPVQIWVGHTLGGRNALTWQLFAGTVARLAIMFIVTALLMALAIQTSLAPVHRLRQRIRERTSDDISPLQARVPEELYDLADALNTLFERQRAGREALLRFTADASHQLRTPLAGIQNTCELALQNERPQEWLQALHTIHQSSARTSRLASQLLSLARLRHADTADPEVIDLRQLLRDTVMHWAEREAARGHDLGLAPLPPAPVRVRGESWSLQEMIGNLIDNALRYTPAGTEITLALTANADTARISIRDTGPGVAPERLDHLHQPFERAGRQDTEGSGLGLAIVDSIVRRHRGSLRFHSKPGHGMGVDICLPRLQEDH